MMRSLLSGALAVVTVLGIGVAICAAETVSIQAKAKDNPQQNADDVEGHFQETPTGEKDEIHVTNTNVNGEHAGVYSDPVNDGALLTIVQQAGPVKVDVEGREGIGAMYWVTVTPTGGGGGQGGQKTILWGDVEDMNQPGALVLKDTNTGAGKSDTTDSTSDTPTLYCTGPLPAGTGTVEIRLNAESGTYDWEIQGTSYSGVFDGTYVTTQSGIDPGTYTLDVTSRSDGTFRRVIDLAVIELGEYLPATYPEDEIDVTEVSETTSFYYNSEGGELRSITVSAPLDGEYEGTEETNPYVYGEDYVVTLNPDDATASIALNLPGVYMLQLIRESGGQLITTHTTLALDSEAFLLPPCEWPIVLILRPHWGLNLVYTIWDIVYAFPGSANPKAKYTVWFGAPAASSVQDLVNARYAALGNKKFDLAINSHGKPGQVQGDLWITKNNVAAVLGNKIAGKIKRIRFYTCNTGELPDGGTFLQNLKNASNATETSAYISSVSCSCWPYVWSAGKWGDKTVK